MCYGVQILPRQIDAYRIDIVKILVFISASDRLSILTPYVFGCMRSRTRRIATLTVTLTLTLTASRAWTCQQGRDLSAVARAGGIALNGDPSGAVAWRCLSEACAVDIGGSGYACLKRVISPADPFTWSLSAAASSSRVRPGCSAFGSRSVATNVQV